MKKICTALWLIVLILSNNLLAQQKTPGKDIKIDNLEIPAVSAVEKVIRHTGYSLLFNDTYKQADWVAYELTKEETTKRFERNNKFVTDPLVTTGTASDKDYAGSGYDKGHLAPAADMEWSSTAMAESFYYSNMSPQEPGFNRGIWKKLEELVRTWAIENNSLYIVTGPILTEGLPAIGPDHVAVPKYFYKVILDYTGPEIKGIGFIIPNTGSSEPLQTFSVTIDSVEKFTGIDFFPLLPDDQENIIESRFDLNLWDWVNSNASNENKKVLNSDQSKTDQSNTKTNSQNTERRSNPVQCSGISKSGDRCRRMTNSPNGFCFQHGGN
jgi:endonuclease G, mitochondrial